MRSSNSLMKATVPLTFISRAVLRRNLVLNVLSSLVVVLGLLVIVGWHTQNIPWIQGAHGLTPMVYNTAVSFVALGTALLLISLNRWRLGKPLVIFAGLLSALTLFEYLSGRSLGIDELLRRAGTASAHPGRMAPNTAVCLLLLSAATLTGRRAGSVQRWITPTAILASIAIGISAISFVGYVFGYETFQWGPFTPMAPNTSIGLILLGAGMLMLAWPAGAMGRSPVPPWLYLAVTCAALIMTISLWRTLAATEHKQLEFAVQAQLESVKSELRAQIGSRIAGLVRSARRWEHKGAPEEAEWEFETRLLMADLQGYQAMGWVDANYRTRWVNPLRGDESLLGTDFRKDASRYEALEYARSHRQPALTHVLQLLGDRGRGFNLYVPLYRGPIFEGFIAGRFECRDLFSSVLPATLAPGYAVAVFDGTQELYSRPGNDARWESAWSHQVGIDLENARWTLKVWPNPAEVELMRSDAPKVVLAAGLLLSMFLGLTTFLAQIAWQKTRASEQARLRLENEISERRRAEQELEQFFTVSPDMLCIAGFDGYFKRLNPAWASRLGWSLEQLLAEPWLHFVHPEDVDATQGAKQNLETGMSVLSFENRYRAADGSYHWLEWNTCPNAERQLIFAAARDITGEKATQEALLRARDELENRVRERTAELEQTGQALHDSEALFRKLFEDSPIGAALIGLDRRINRVNKALCEWLGFSAAELVALDLEAITFDEDVPVSASLLRQMVDGQIPGYCHVKRYLRKNGEIVWGSLTATIIRDERGKALTALCMIENITERILKDQEIAHLTGELQARVAQLTVVNQELESFNYTVSHDLRAPLRHIDGYSKILLDGYGAAMPEDAHWCIERVRGGAQRMGRMVDELLELSRTSRRELSKQLTELRSLVFDVIEELKPEAQNRKIEWLVGELPFVDCDPILARQVFANLLSNAVKFTRTRQRAVIEVGEIKSDGQTVLFVRDNGVGFSMKYADKLFGVFQRLHRREDFEGTGIGLVTVQRIVQKHGGRIWAEAELDKGATFYFTLASQAPPEQAAIETGCGSARRKAMPQQPSSGTRDA